MGSVGRHTWILPNNGKNTWEMLVGTPGSHQIIIKQMGNVESPAYRAKNVLKITHLKVMMNHLEKGKVK